MSSSKKAAATEAVLAAARAVNTARIEHGEGSTEYNGAVGEAVAVRDAAHEAGVGDSDMSRAASRRMPGERRAVDTVLRAGRRF